APALGPLTLSSDPGARAGPGLREGEGRLRPLAGRVGARAGARSLGPNRSTPRPAGRRHGRRVAAGHAWRPARRDPRVPARAPDCAQAVAGRPDDRAPGCARPSRLLREANRPPHVELAVIVTVTLNAALDRTLTVPNLQRGQRHRASQGLMLAGGKGINIARALKLLGVPVVATGLVGGRTGLRIVEELTGEAILNDFVRIGDESRTSTA